MPQDAFNLRHLTAELNALFKGGKINKIIQPDNDKIVLTVYTGQSTERLFLDVDPGSPRIGVCDVEQNVPLTAPNFCMLLRKHLSNATLNGISLVGFDRIVKIDLTPSQEFFDDKDKVLYVELMGRYSNVILTENGKVLGGNRGVNFFDNGVRPLIVGRDYTLPPSNGKLLPNDENLIAILGGFDRDNFAEKLSATVQGIATQTAREIEYRFNEKHTEKKIENFGKKLYDFLNGFLYGEKPDPQVYYSENTPFDVCAVEYRSYKKPSEKFSTLIKAEKSYFSIKDEVKKLAQKKDKYNGVINALIKKTKKKITAITARESDAENCEENRIKGELILANIYKIKQGDKKVKLLNYYDGNEVEIELDEHLTPAKNSERYYKKYNKQKRSMEALIPQKEQAEKELSYYISVLEEIGIAQTQEDFIYIENELENTGVINKPAVKGQKKVFTPKFKEYVIDGVSIKAGRNNTENDKLTFSAKPEDIWVHTRLYHSSHVIIETEGKDVEKEKPEVLLKACEICAYYSKGRDGGKCEVVYTKRKFVKKPSKSKAGFCTYTDFKSVMVEPDKHDNYLKNN